MSRLSQFFRVKRRYSRSINLERDLLVPDALAGYVLTPRAWEALERITVAASTPHAPRAWTISGVYGTGKSAFVHLLASLYGPAGDQARTRASALVRAHPGGGKVIKSVTGQVADSGWLRAVVTGRREPLAHTVVRGLSRGAEELWAGRKGRVPAALGRLRQLMKSLSDDPGLSVPDVPELAASLARAAGTGLLIVVDELGKNLEFAARSGGSDDLYLLQQLAELPAAPGSPPVLVVGLLHQAFSEYEHGLTSGERNEWAKVQGRFEDVPFAESPEQMLGLMADAIEGAPAHLQPQVAERARSWHRRLRAAWEHPYVADVLTEERIRRLIPLHPIAALVLPSLCTKYAQNDRSLFTFLTSNEPHSFTRFLEEQSVLGDEIPLLTLPDVYDYFIDVAGSGFALRPQFQRWAEVHGLISDAVGLEPDELAALKTVGVLNLVTSTGPLRASRAMVLAALTQRPDDPVEEAHWVAVLDRLAARRITTYRHQLDEIRIWEGSDYDVEAEVRSRVEAETRPLAALLQSAAPLSPTVAQRHSYRTGTLRYFERVYVDGATDLTSIKCSSTDIDGVVAYWVGSELPVSVPARASDGRPLVTVVVGGRGALITAAREYLALQALEDTDTALQTDGVARREVRHRLGLARMILDDAVQDAFESGQDQSYYVGSEKKAGVRLNALLSQLCDEAYPKGVTLWNELLNRRELTSQAARARRELIDALINQTDQERLGIKGDGPEYSMYSAALLRTGIHREIDGEWMVAPPTDEGVAEAWAAIERFCLEANDSLRSLDELHAILDAPPYGIKRGFVPVLLAAVLLYHADDVTVYRDGTFMPLLGAEQFEVLVKQPSLFAVKHFELKGLGPELFQRIQEVLSATKGRFPRGIRNATLLGIVRPLIQFAAGLPPTTRRTALLSPAARAVREALAGAREPDQLLLSALPAAVGCGPLVAAEDRTEERLEEFRTALLGALRELQSHYPALLDRCRRLLHDLFGVSSDLVRLREDLRVRAQYLIGQVIEPKLRSFVNAVSDPDLSEDAWLEAILDTVVRRAAETWSDEDALAFEANLNDYARRFAELESLQKEAARERREGFEARRVTLTEPGGRELNRLVWIDREEQPMLEELVTKLLADVKALRQEHHRHAVAVSLLERLLREDEVSDGENIASIPLPRARHG